MLVIVEGVDLAGKSTFLENLSKKVNAGFIVKNTMKPRSNANGGLHHWEELQKLKHHYMQISLIGATFPSTMPIYLDRFYPSQIVYSILRGHDDFTDNYYCKFEEMIQDIACLIMIYEDEDVLTQRFAVRGDEHVTLDQILLLKKRYDEFFVRCTLPKIKLKSTDPDILLKATTFMSVVQAERS